MPTEDEIIILNFRQGKRVYYFMGTNRDSIIADATRPEFGFASSDLHRKIDIKSARELGLLHIDDGIKWVVTRGCESYLLENPENSRVSV